MVRLHDRYDMIIDIYFSKGMEWVGGNMYKTVKCRWTYCQVEYLIVVFAILFLCCRHLLYFASNTYTIFFPDIIEFSPGTGNILIFFSVAVIGFLRYIPLIPSMSVTDSCLNVRMYLTPR
jgi:hypothetical protein